MPLTTFRGHNCFYVDEGVGEAVMLVHGYTGCWDDWATTIPAASRQYRCIALDQRGFGRSDHPESESAYTMSAYVEDIVSLARQLGVDRFHLAGVSLGGMIAQEFALAHQDMLLSLALVDTTPQPPPVMEGELNPDESAEFLEDHTVGELWEVYHERVSKRLPLANPAVTEEELAAAKRRYVNNNSQAGIVGCGRMIRNWAGVADRLGEITLRTLVVVGEMDEMFVEPSQRLAALLPDVRLVVLPKCGHVPMFDRPDLFNRIYLDFLSEG